MESVRKDRFFAFYKQDNSFQEYLNMVYFFYKLANHFVYIVSKTNDIIKVSGGVITGGNRGWKIENYPGQSGGAITVHGTLNLNSGNIIGNQMDYGGGIYLHTCNSTMTMTGGIIAGNKSKYFGGGVYANTNSTFNMLGGIIAYNIADGFGGGIINNGDINIKGNASIKGNVAKCGTEYYNPSNLVIFQNKPISLDGYSGAKIGVSILKKDVNTSKYSTCAGDVTKAVATDYSNCFNSEDSQFKIKKSGSGNNQKVILSEGHVHVFNTAITEDDITFDKELPSDNWNNTLETGNYVLTDDVELTQSITIPTGANVNLCLNGHVLKGNGDFSVFKNNGTLNIYDCNSTAHYFKVGQNGLWSLTSDSTGAVALKSLTTQPTTSTIVKVNGGVITGGTGSVESTLQSLKCGGAIDNHGTLTLDGVNIIGNSAAYGGGIYLHNITASKMTMNSGVIAGNISTKKGGGVYASQSSTFTMNGGTISNNTATEGGGGVFVCDNNLTLGGAAVIKNNTKATTNNNLEMNQGKYFTVSASSPLAKGANIGITYSSTGTIGKNAKAGNENYFTADDSAKHISRDSSSNDLKIEEGYPITIKVNGGGGIVLNNTTLSESNVKKARSGDKISVQPTQANIYDIDTISVYKTANNEKINVVDKNTFTMPAESVTVEVSLKQHSYQFTTVTDKKGTITVTNSSGTDITSTGAAVGTTVTVNTTPIFKFYKANIEVYKTGDQNKKVSVDENNQFTMPEFDVTISATFAETEQPCPVHRFFRKVAVGFKNLFS